MSINSQLTIPLGAMPAILPLLSESFQNDILCSIAEFASEYYSNGVTNWYSQINLSFPYQDLNLETIQKIAELSMLMYSEEVDAFTLGEAVRNLSLNKGVNLSFLFNEKPGCIACVENELRLKKGFESYIIPHQSVKHALQNYIPKDSDVDFETYNLSAFVFNISFVESRIDVGDATVYDTIYRGSDGSSEALDSGSQIESSNGWTSSDNPTDAYSYEYE